MSNRNGNRATRERERLDFAKIKTTVQIPNLIDVQKKSYQRFLQMDLLPSEREDTGLQSVFTSVFPIQDFRGLSQLDFVDYAIGNWECKCGHLRGLHHLRATCRNCGASVVTNPYKTGDVLCTKCGTFNKNTPTFCNKCGDPVTLQLKYDVNECQERGMTYSAPLKVTIRLTIYDKDPDTGAKSIRDIKEQEVFFGDIPLMTENGTFIINGTERVIVSQLHRSPGVFFETANNRSYFLGKIIPYRGSWVEFEYDTKNILYVRIDRKRKFLGSIFLRALGMKSNEDILRTFYQVERISLRDGELHWNASEGLIDRKLSKEVKHPKTGETLVGAHKRISDPLYKELVKAKVTQVEVGVADLEGAITVGELVNRQTGEVLLEANKALTAETWATVAEAGITEVDVCFPERDDVGIIVARTLEKDTIRTPKEALIEIYRKLRPGDPPTLETATALFNGMFFDARKYDFSKVGRLKFNIKLGLETPLDKRTLDPSDFVAAIKYLLKLRKNIGTVDDIDHQQIYPKPGWVEHDPAEIWRRVEQVIQEAMDARGLKPADLSGIGVANQRETTVLWNRKTGKTVYNAIVWQDTRVATTVAEFTANGGQDRFRAKTGLPLATYFSGLKIRWILRNVTGARATANAGELLFGNIDTFLIWNLTGGVDGGVHVTDVTNASRTQLMDLKTLNWDTGILEEFDIPPSILPRIASSAEIYGRAVTGPVKDVAIAGDLGDQQAALFGQACFTPGETKNTYGTGCFMLMNTGSRIVPSTSGLLTTLGYKIGAQPAVYALEGSIAITGALVQWLRDNLGLIEKSSEIEALARTVDDNGGVYFVPAFSGLYAPYWKDSARGVIAGLTRYVNRGHIARAALEATAFQVREVLDAMKKDSGIELANLRSDGGMVQNNLLMQFQADILNKAVLRPVIQETTALGAAYAAGLATGFLHSTEEVAANWAEDHRWTPSMDEEKRSSLYHFWKKAVTRSFDWVES